MKLLNTTLLLGLSALLHISVVSLSAGEFDGKAVIDPKAAIVEGDGDDEGSGYPVDENLWLYTKGVKVRKHNSLEAKLGGIARLGKREGSYSFLDIRPELEYGLTDNLTVGGSFFLFDHNYDNVPWAPMVETQGGPGGSFDDTSIGGWEVFLKYNIFHPLEDWAGLSVGLSYDHRYKYRLDHADISQDALSPQIFLQKSFLDDRLQWALKGKVEFESRTSPGILEEEIAPDVATGLSYGLTDELWIGIEARWQSDFLSPEEDGVVEGKASNWDWNEWALGDQFQWGLYVGPSIHWNPPGDWWITAGALWQVAGWSADGAAASSGGRNWDEHEEWHVGLLVGFEWDDFVPGR